MLIASQFHSTAALPGASLSQCADQAAEALLARNEDYAPLLPYARALAGNSPYLASVITQYPDFFVRLFSQELEASLLELEAGIAEAAKEPQREIFMATLRQLRHQWILVLACFDWLADTPAKSISIYLSALADHAIQSASHFALRAANRKGVIHLPTAENGEFTGTGLLILAMGKWGACELNYSSDIDFIVCFDPDQLDYHGRQTKQHFFNQLTQEICCLLQDRTRNGFVFRTDLRLRPDPRSTPLAVNLNSAIAYYETTGQNWERAAMIKARPVVYDAPVAQRFQQAMQAFIWRKHLDFSAIADIDSIMRQISARQEKLSSVRGYNVKLGQGGIREIELLIQTKQLVWGGRDDTLRTRASAESLDALGDAGHLTRDTVHFLTKAYWFYRRIEHAIQLERDQQNHTIPDSDVGLSRLSAIMGFNDIAAFETAVIDTSERVHHIYVTNMQGRPSLSLGGNLVFTGVEPDPDTISTLSRLGFDQPVMVCERIQQWHRGDRRATRSAKARALLTEITPALLKALSETANPGEAFLRFDEFLGRVPVGVQIFSLLSTHAEILETLCLILGSAPALGETLTQHPALLDFLVSRQSELLPFPALSRACSHHMARQPNMEEKLRFLRRFKQEEQFKIGLCTLKDAIDIDTAMKQLSALAEVILHHAIEQVRAEFTEHYGTIPQANFAVLALGKLGTGELTFHSDLDVILLYNGDESIPSDGAKSLYLTAYYQRFASRLTTALTSLMQEGVLYDLDLRLRPGGVSSPLATSLKRFDSYFDQDGWDVEALALTRARVLYATSPAFQQKLEASLLSILDRGYDAKKLATGISQLRERITAQFPTSDPFNVKYISGGLMDLSLTAQYWRLIQPAWFQGKQALCCDEVFAELKEQQAISSGDADQWTASYRFQRKVQHMLRLCSVEQSLTPDSPTSLLNLISCLCNQPDFASLKNELTKHQKHTKQTLIF